MQSRTDAIGALATERFDVLVIGGGITGAGVALDAASRGYRVALAEQADFAAGTSSRSSKLVHGGLRYLQQLDLALVREALRERALMVRLAPHLVRPLPFVVPAFTGRRPDRTMGIGLNMYDVMASPPLRGRIAARRNGGPAPGEWHPARHRLIDAAETIDLLPALADRRPTGGYLFYDCQTDDARLVLTVLQEAEAQGAVCARGVRVTGVRGAAADVVDLETGTEFPVRVRNVVNATGVWADRLGPGRIAPSRGTHITLPADVLPLRAGAIVPAGGGRSIFALPWLGRTLVGTTDSAYDGPLDHIRPAAEDIDYLLCAVNGFFGTSLDGDAISGAFAGARPLIASAEQRRSVDISRRAELYESPDGLITITGGKLTTWRRMAKLVVDRLIAREGRSTPCRTDELPLGVPIDPAQLPRVAGVADAAYQHLAGRYGQAASAVLAHAAQDPALAEPLVPGLPDIAAEAVHAVVSEQAQTVGDVLLRRTRLGLLAGRELMEPGGAGPELVARAMAPALGWDPARIAAEIAAFADEAAAEGLDGDLVPPLAAGA